MNVYFSENAIDNVISFFNYYQYLYLRLYDDTGLGPAEEYIKKSYRDSATKMREWLFRDLNDYFAWEILYGYSIDSSNTALRNITKTYWSYRILVKYEESQKNRIIHNISIQRK